MCWLLHLTFFFTNYNTIQVKVKRASIRRIQKNQNLEQFVKKLLLLLLVNTLNTVTLTVTYATKNISFNNYIIVVNVCELNIQQTYKYFSMHAPC